VRDPEKGLTGHPEPSGRLARASYRVAWYASSVGLERGARLGAVAVVPLLLVGSSYPHAWGHFGALATYVLVTALAPRDHRLRAADLLVSAVLIALTEGQVVPFLPFLIVTVAGPASAGGIRAGLAAGGTLSIVLLATLTWTGQLPALGLGGALPAALLLPLVGVTSASAAQVLADRVVEDRLVLQEANRLLSSLRDLADDIPGGLDISTVSAAILAEARTIEGAGASIVYAEDLGLLQPAASTRLSPGQLPSIRLDELRAVVTAGSDTTTRFVARWELPAILQPVTREHPHWAVVGIGRDGHLVGVLLIGFDENPDTDEVRSRLSSIAADGALALENARLFDGTRVRAADAARRRIAGDLHDGVAQSLAHIRMELELLARHAAAPEADEVARLARVAGSALEDLRATIGGLRRPLHGDLSALIARHLEEVRSPTGPDLAFSGPATAVLDPERTEDVLRIVQEAVSNSLRHARAAFVSVSLAEEAGQLVLHVQDDGIGLRARTVRPGTGVGLRSMQERADRLGGELVVRELPGGGTFVLLRFPVAPPPAPSPRPDHRFDHLRTGR
jgi:signal transduction histidine kinase